MVIVKQPTNWSCWAAVCAMITETTCEDFFAFIGHDGGGDWDPESTIIDGALRAGFCDIEACVYLLRHGYRLGTTIVGPIDEEGWCGFPAILYVASERYEGVTHMVYWDGKVVRDPNPNVGDERRLDEFEIKWHEQVIPFPTDARYEKLSARISLEVHAP